MGGTAIQLEIVKIVIKSDNIPCLVPLFVLNLPQLTRHASIVRLACRAPTGPGPQAIPAPYNQPFCDKAEDAIYPFQRIDRRYNMDAENSAGARCGR